MYTTINPVLQLAPKCASVFCHSHKTKLQPGKWTAPWKIFQDKDNVSFLTWNVHFLMFASVISHKPEALGFCKQRGSSLGWEDDGFRRSWRYGVHWLFMASTGHRIISGHRLAFEFHGWDTRSVTLIAKHFERETEQGAIILLTRIPTFVF